MAKIYDTPKEVVEDVSYEDSKSYEECEAKFEKDLKDHLDSLGYGGGKYYGKIAKFQAGDGYAKYMVASISPLKLIHMAYGDKWEFPYVHKMNAKDIRENIDSTEAMDKMFSKA